jgi:ribosomal protein S6--L-glutamate ligase
MRFAIIAERRYLGQRMPAELLRALLEAGYSADIICSDDVVCDFRSGTPSFDTYDLVIARDRSLVGLSLLAWAEKAGGSVVNSRVAIEGVRNKAEMTATLFASGIPMPPTVVCRSADQLKSLADSYFPLVLKPNFGDNGNGVHVIRAGDLRQVKSRDSSVVLAQTFVPNDGFDLKLYVAGTRVWAVRKPNLWSSTNGHGQVSQVPVDEEMRSLALRCGAALGLEVYGVDTLPGPQGIQVIEVNEFPNFSGIVEAPRVLADFLAMKAKERRAETSRVRAPDARRTGVSIE